MELKATLSVSIASLRLLDYHQQLLGLSLAKMSKLALQSWC